MKRGILVTGGCGFIGTHLVHRLVQSQRYHVTVIDIVDGFQGKDLRRHNVEFIRADLRDIVRFDNILVDRGIDTVCHLARATIPETSIKDPLSALRENLDATIGLLETCRRVGVKRFIFLSSGGTVYGEPKQQPEETPGSPFKINTATQAGKRALFFPNTLPIALNTENPTRSVEMMERPVREQKSL